MHKFLLAFYLNVISNYIQSTIINEIIRRNDDVTLYNFTMLIIICIITYNLYVNSKLIFAFIHSWLLIY